MKKILTILMIFTLMFSLAACGGNSESQSETQSAQKETSSNTETKATVSDTENNASSTDSKALVVYFSRTGEQYNVGMIEKGNTAIVADMIAAETGADTFEILPKEDNYPTTYSELTDYAKEEQNNNARPAIKDTVKNFDQYDTIFLGYPIWWGDLPMICYTFLESYDFSGKTIVPFCTHEGSADAGTQSKIQSAVPNATVKEVLAIQGQEAQNDQDSAKAKVLEWLN